MKFISKTNSRIIAMMLLYIYDINKELDVDKSVQMILENNNLNLKDDEAQEEVEYDKEFLDKLIDGVIIKKDYLDYIISLVIEGYTLDTLSFVDRNILRMATYELIYMHTPKQIVINEAVNVAKVYSEIEGFKAGNFDNAVLDKIANAHFKEE